MSLWSHYHTHKNGKLLGIRYILEILSPDCQETEREDLFATT
jgi:hypothetical protein